MRIQSLRGRVEKSCRFLPLALANSWALVQRLSATHLARSVTQPRCSTEVTIGAAWRAYRNEIAHELPRILVEPGHDIDVARIRQTRDLLAKLGVFWGRIEVDTNPDFDGQEVGDASIQSGVLLLMDHLVGVAEGTEAT